MTVDIWGSRVWLLDQYPIYWVWNWNAKAWNNVIKSLDLKVSNIKINTLLQKMDNLSQILFYFPQSNSFSTHLRMKGFRTWNQKFLYLYVPSIFNYQFYHAIEG